MNAYTLAKERYAALGVDTEAVLETLKNVTVSVHCWQGDDVVGFDAKEALSGGIQTTGNYPGKATTPEQLMADFDEVLRLTPGKKKLNLHASYAIFEAGEFADRDAIQPKHFSRWVAYAKERGLGIDFNPTFFSHSMVKDGLTLSSPDETVRKFWVEHGKRCMAIAEYFAEETGKPCVINFWIPDGYKDYPADRLAHMVEDSGIALVLTQAAVRERLPGAAALQVLEFDTLDLSGEPDTDPQVDVNPDSLAYVIYTSGSTGKPKGAQLSHRNVARLLDATDAWFGFGPDDVWTLFHSYAFDFSVWEIFGALCTGGRLVVVPYWVSRSPQDFLALLRAERVTVLNQTPSAFGQLVHAVEQEDGNGAGLALRQVIFGGEALEPESLRPWFDRFGDQSPQLANM